MGEVEPSEPNSSPTVEVIVFQHGHEIARELCESSEEAAVIVDWWNEQDGVECQVDDLSIHHCPDDILEPTADGFVEDADRTENTP
jgi:hypothetical protein